MQKAIIKKVLGGPEREEDQALSLKRDLFEKRFGWNFLLSRPVSKEYICRDPNTALLGGVSNSAP